ncbi:hypothetical protein BLOT_016616, partial [Blomia tropicalis]
TGTFQTETTIATRHQILSEPSTQLNDSAIGSTTLIILYGKNFHEKIMDSNLLYNGEMFWITLDLYDMIYTIRVQIQIPIDRLHYMKN